ncbi:MAG: exopolysaccharide Pel transporter PelG [Pseudooceanicola sp.]
MNAGLRTWREGAADLAHWMDWWLDGPLLGPVRRILSALIVAAGPWLIAVAALIFVSRTMAPSLGALALEDLRLTVIYAFMLAPMAATPVGVIAARAVGRGEAVAGNVGALLLLSCGMAGGAATLLAGGIALAFGLEGASLVPAFILLTSVSAMMWTTFPVLAALRARRRLVTAFAAGMSVAVLLTHAMAGIADSNADIIWCFILGTGVSLGIACLPFRYGAMDPDRLRAARGMLVGSAAQGWPLAFGAWLAITGIWVDKWVYWAAPDGLRSVAGFYHYPPYDGVMFLAHLSVVPALAALAAFQEGPVSRAMRAFRAGIPAGDTLDGLGRRRDALRAVVWDGMIRIFGAQFVFSAGLILLAPAVAHAVGFRLDQFLMLRVGLLAAVLHALFLAASAIIVLTNARRVFALLQFGFLLLNAGIGMLVLEHLGVSAIGLTVTACLAAMMALPLAAWCLARLVRLTFLDENEALA